MKSAMNISTRSSSTFADQLSHFRRAKAATRHNLPLISPQFDPCPLSRVNFRRHRSYIGIGNSLGSCRKAFSLEVHILDEMAHRIVRGLRGAVKNLVFRQPPKPINQFLKYSTRNCASDMQESAFEANILRLLRNEIQYELSHSPLSTAIPEFDSFKVDERPGEQWIRLSRKFGENEEIKVEVTMFDGSVPMKMHDEKEDVKLHVTLIVDVFKGKDCDVLEFVCSGWPDGIEIRNVFTRGHDGIKAQPFMGPEFKELDDELQDSLYDFLEARGIDDKLAEFLHKYMWNKDKNEYLRWMGNMQAYIQKK